jgi:aldehyde:ferredoxin oxidoreductase
MVAGYRGKILKVNMSSEEITENKLDEKDLRAFIGGAGLGCRLLYDMVDKETDPLGPENPLIFLTGPFTGTMIPTGSKSTFCAKSPLTGILGYSTVGGHFGADLRFAGYDGIVFVEQASEPKLLRIKDSQVSLEDAGHLWGKNTEVVWEALKEDPEYRNAGVARIGIAGEKLVKFASVIVDHQRAAGRTGMGAVMGSKNLKAIVVKGTDRKIPVHDADMLSAYADELKEDYLQDPSVRMYSDLGTAGFVDMASLMYGSLPAGYYTVSDFDSYNLSGTSVRESILVGKKACFRCPIGCGRVINVKEGKYATGVFKGPELEVTGTMGTEILNNDLDALAFLTKKIDLAGFDSLSGGNTIAFAFYLFNEGIITARDLDGIEPNWGNADAASALIDKIEHREGVGDLMAEGAVAFGEKFGVANLVVHAHRLEYPQHDPRGFSGHAVGYATSSRGACHMSADMYNVQMGQVNEELEIESVDRFADEAVITARQQDFRCITNSIGICNFAPFKAGHLVKLLRLTTGWDYSIEELKATGERIFTLMRLLNLKLGYDVKGETLPELITRPLEGPTEGHVPNIEEQLDTWYTFRGWDRKTGMPPRGTIKRLGLEGI